MQVFCKNICLTFQVFKCYKICTKYLLSEHGNRFSSVGLVSFVQLSGRYSAGTGTGTYHGTWCTVPTNRTGREKIGRYRTNYRTNLWLFAMNTKLRFIQYGKYLFIPQYTYTTKKQQVISGAARSKLKITFFQQVHRGTLTETVPTYIPHVKVFRTELAEKRHTGCWQVCSANRRS